MELCYDDFASDCWASLKWWYLHVFNVLAWELCDHFWNPTSQPWNVRGKVGEVPQLTWGRRSLIVSGLLAAVSYLHRHDPNGPCYHRDIKPANIMLTASLSPKLSDCGLSRFLPQDRPGQNRMTMQLTTGAGPAGTPGFMCRRYVSTGKFDEKFLGFASFSINLGILWNFEIQNSLQGPVCLRTLIFFWIVACNWMHFCERGSSWCEVWGVLLGSYNSPAHHGRAGIQ